ncbi:uncharacterized protein BO80DRAFT_434967 [Aspergillus ibericus CBS 121593]|uniref:Uncharacterized protein n=1 Tax=Aspergillus ibericus CBS 121593 TaxID=1448316 RepID=A0A395GZ84_9EURO|nr:hypothetical protein BO80DRAFT_434967 [Aspergillus ibericus CBS 121593]RAL00897.1 hypothetical protein BO80DRAFT_434967 [Aspergillus ibericus CBS 121593]
MMVPRAFLFSSVPSAPKSSLRQHGEKIPVTKSSLDLLNSQDLSGLELPSETSPPSMHTSPVIIPPKRAPRVTSVLSQTAIKGPNTPKKSRTVSHRSSSATLADRPVPSSIASILEATAIPVPRRNWSVRESRNRKKLPRGNHVQDFSKLLMDGVGDNLVDSTGNTTLDLLLSPPEELDRSTVGSDCDSEAPSFSACSLSVASTPSLDRDFDSPCSLPAPSTPSSHRSPLERKFQRQSPCENCIFDHPLLDTETSDTEEESVGQATLSGFSPKTPTPSRTLPRLGSTFKSNLTASLRAIKSAAQSVSAFATPSVQPDDFLTRSLFTITPEMTDDRRPPPMNEPPSPALRRYLNPITVSPAEMYAYQEYPHEPLDTHNCPVSVQMQTYHRSGRRGSRRSGFHLARSEGRDKQLLPFDPEIPPMSRQREPRENSDFLRMVVLEMNMRRSGKLRDDIPTRARIWLPPRKGSQGRYMRYEYYEDEDENAVPSRWVGVSVAGAIPTVILDRNDLPNRYLGIVPLVHS